VAHSVSSFPSEKNAKISSAGKPLDILVIDDVLNNIRLTSKYLEKMGHRSFSAALPEEAIRLLRKQRFDVILMDVHMPGMDGMQLTQCIRSGSLGKVNINVPIIAVTAHALQGDRERCMAAGMNGYITKPFQMETLANCLAQIKPGAPGVWKPKAIFSSKIS
jgi:CheY-like chemotaxis protein